MRRWLIVVLGLELLSIPLSLLAPVPLAVAIDCALGNKDLPAFLSWLPASVSESTLSLLVFAGVLQVAVAILAGLVSWSSTLVKLWTSERITLDLRGRMLAHAQQLSFRFHDKTRNSRLHLSDSVRLPGDRECRHLQSAALPDVRRHAHLDGRLWCGS